MEVTISIEKITLTLRGTADDITTAIETGIDAPARPLANPTTEVSPPSSPDNGKDLDIATLNQTPRVIRSARRPRKPRATVDPAATTTNTDADADADTGTRIIQGRKFRGEFYTLGEETGVPLSSSEAIAKSGIPQSRFFAASKAARERGDTTFTASGQTFGVFGGSWK
jgi:hypothetical protein